MTDVILSKDRRLGVLKYTDGAVYEGTLNGNIHNGLGVMKYPNGDIYAGEWNLGKQDGQGKLIYAEGTFVGAFHNNQANGLGTFTFKDGTVYEGHWVNDTQEGEGTMTHPNGLRYTGSWSANQYHGFGRLWMPDGTTYTGEWQRHKRHGHGSIVYPDGARYDGDFNDNAKHGFGLFRYADGAKYEGEFYNGRQEGQGKFTYPSKDVYAGGWKNNLQHGHGKMVYADGRKYSGDWHDGMKEGQGTFTFPDGTSYVGGWKNDIQHGEGTLTDADGNWWRTVWKDGTEGDELMASGVTEVKARPHHPQDGHQSPRGHRSPPLSPPTPKSSSSPRKTTPTAAALEAQRPANVPKPSPNAIGSTTGAFVTVVPAPLPTPAPAPAPKESNEEAPKKPPPLDLLSPPRGPKHVRFALDTKAPPSPVIRHNAVESPTPAYARLKKGDQDSPGSDDAPGGKRTFDPLATQKIVIDPEHVGQHGARTSPHRYIINRAIADAPIDMAIPLPTLKDPRPSDASESSGPVAPTPIRPPAPGNATTGAPAGATGHQRSRSWSQGAQAGAHRDQFNVEIYAAVPPKMVIAQPGPVHGPPRMMPGGRAPLMTRPSLTGAPPEVVDAGAAATTLRRKLQEKRGMLKDTLMSYSLEGQAVCPPGTMSAATLRVAIKKLKVKMTDGEIAFLESTFGNAGLVDYAALVAWVEAR